MFCIKANGSVLPMKITMNKSEVTRFISRRPGFYLVTRDGHDVAIATSQMGLVWL